MKIIIIYDARELLMHPILKNIPYHLWCDSFSCKILEDELSLLDVEIEESLSIIVNSHSARNLIKLLLLVNYCHKDASFKTLNQILLKSDIHKLMLLEFACITGNVTLLNSIILNLDKGVFASLLSNENYSCFRLAAANGHLEIINRLCELAPELVVQMINAKQYYAVRFAARNGHLDAINLLFKLNPDLVSQIIETRDFDVFALAATGGHLQIVNRLCELAPELITQMIESNHYSAFRFAARRGHLEIIERLAELMPDSVLKMIEAENYFAVRMAAHDGHLEIINHLCNLAPESVNQIIKADEYGAFREATISGHLEIIDRLCELSPDSVVQMIKADEYGAFREAASNGQLSVINRLCELRPGLITQMIQAYGYDAFLQAAKNGHLEVVNRLCELVPGSVCQMIESSDYYAFRFAVKYNHHKVVNKLLEHPIQFAYAEMHDREYGEEYVYPFVTSKLTELRALKEDYESLHAEGVFDCEDNQTSELGFYLLRNLIRRNDERLLDDMRFLLSIPSIKNKVHLAITPGVENELLRLALTLDNAPACELLLTIPAVRDLAVENNYYLAEQRGEIDLSRLAQDSESSMRALSSSESKRLTKLKSHYQPLIQAAGINNIIDDLKLALVNRYYENPAVAVINGKETALPFDWDEYSALNLTKLEQKAALIAYYQHKDHTAYRYLSKPNHWMAPNAGYVYINEERDERWSTFEEYQPLIALLWLAANDEQISVVDGHSVESRINHFIDELTQIGRAHNWDRAREVIYPDGSTGIEEYDDLEGDKPSCYSGVKRRLFQSLIGHPLFTLFSQDILEQEFNHMLSVHFKECINPENVELIKQALDAVLEGEPLTKHQQESLIKLNVPNALKSEFTEQMMQKYKDSINARSLDNWVTDKLTLTGSLTCHIFKFYTHIAMQAIIDTASNQRSKAKHANGGEGSSSQHSNSSAFFTNLQYGNDSNQKDEYSKTIQKKNI